MIPSVGYLSGFNTTPNGTHYQSQANAPGSLAGSAAGFIASALIRPPGIGPAAPGFELGHVCGVFDSGNTQGWAITYNSTPATIVVDVRAYDSLGVLVTAAGAFSVGAGPLSAERAMLVHGVYDAAGGFLELYVNGMQLATAAAANPFAPAARPLSIGLNEATDTDPVVTGGIAAVGFRNGAPAAQVGFLVGNQWDRAARGGVLPQTDDAGTANFYNHLFSVRRGQARPNTGVADLWQDQISGSAVVLQKQGLLTSDGIVAETGLADWA